MSLYRIYYWTEKWEKRNLKYDMKNISKRILKKTLE